MFNRNRENSQRTAATSDKPAVTHRTVYVGDDIGTRDALEEEPRRPGPPVTGPGITHNEVVTSQYTVQNFVFKNLWKQFHRAANCYFLFISMLQCIKAVSITGGVPTTLLPLLFVLFVTALKDAIEDFNRCTENDNHQKARVLTNKPEDIRWHEVKVSDLLIVRNRELLPADMVMLASSESNGLAYVMTANLDGETNLKAKEVKKEFASLPHEIKLRAKIICDLPNNKLEHFEGTYVLEDGEKISLTGRNILLRGSMLRNTEWILGAVVYTGKETKIQMNSAETPFKIGSLRSFTDRMTFLVFCLQIACCVIGGIAGSIYVANRNTQQMWYIWQGVTVPTPAYSGFLQFVTYIIIFTNFIPISLLVTLDMVKFFQAAIMMFDLNMYYETMDAAGTIVEIPMQVKTSDLNEELGLIEHVFSDKTGTLTCNVMEFCKCSIGGISYGLGITQIGKAWRQRNGLPVLEPPARDPSEPITPFVNIVDPEITAVMRDQSNPNHGKAREFFLHLSLNHDVMPEGDSDERIIYSASSPDESALVYAAKHFGFFFCKREPGKVTVKVDGVKAEFNVLHVLEFTSDRKKSSVILKRDDGSIVLFCKGADNIIKGRLSETRNSAELMTRMEQQLVGYVNDGLRTLMLAKAELDPQEYQNWARRYHDAETSTDNREKRRYQLMDEIEKELVVMGVTAIEDKLQDGVPETLSALREAGIKVWMLTGDKVDTAINIGYSCSLLVTDMTVLRMCGEDGDMALDAERVPTREAIEARMKALLSQFEADRDKPVLRALVVDTYALAAILKYELQGLLVQICRSCKSVICARVSPKQKAKVVEMVKVADRTVQTVAIGDGANDVPMIQTAHIGVGIHGLEGQQAVNNSDYAIGQFRFLRDLLLVHGRWNYRRTSTTIAFIFFKNALLVLPQFFFGIFSMYSGQNFYFDGFYQLYNVVYTAFPVIMLGVFDKDVTREVACSTPGLYRDGLQRVFLNTHVFWGWMLEGIIQSVIVTFIPLYAYGYFNIRPDGQVVGLWDCGTIVFLCVMLVASLRISVEVKDWQWIIASTLVASVAVWWMSWAVFSEWVSAAPEVYGSIEAMGSSSRFWLTLLNTVVICFVVTFLREAVSVLALPRRSQIVQEMKRGWGDAAADGIGGSANIMRALAAAARWSNLGPNDRSKVPKETTVGAA